MRSSQASLEFLVLVGIAMAVLLPVILLVNTQKEHISDAKVFLLTKDSLKKLKFASLSVFNQGVGSKSTVYVFLPSEMQTFNIKGEYVIIRIRTTIGDEDVYVHLPFNLSYVSLPSSPGYYKVEITSIPGGVRYDFIKE